MTSSWLGPGKFTIKGVLLTHLSDSMNMDTFDDGGSGQGRSACATLMQRRHSWRRVLTRRSKFKIYEEYQPLPEAWGC